MNRRATTMPPKSELTMNARNYLWIFTIVLLCVLCAGVVSIAAHPQQNPPQENTPAPPPPTDPQDPRFKLNVEVELVNITATVLDEQGKYMDGLKLEDFQVFEDGQEQKISFFSHRSEEHTSELQSPYDLVCRLLLEKKKKKTKKNEITERTAAQSARADRRVRA